jgi:hypothetical protein
MRCVPLFVLVGLLISETCPGQDEPPQPARTDVPLSNGYALAMGGQYRVLVHAANFSRHSAVITGAQDSISTSNLRMRTWFNLYEPKTKDHGVYIQVEVGGLAFGEEREFPKTSTSGGDEVGLELRRGYLWYQPSEDSLLRVGVLDWQDRFGEKPRFAKPQWSVDAYDSSAAVLANSVWDFNVGGASLEGALPGSDRALNYRLSLFALENGDQTFTGEGGAVFAGADMDYDAGDSLVGASIYYLRDNGDYSYASFGGPMMTHESSSDVWAGLRGHFEFGSVRPSAFVIYNRGQTNNTDWRHEGFAGKLAVDIACESATYSIQTLYSTGNDGSSATRSGEFRTIAQSERDNFGGQGYWSRLGITSPRGPSDINDLGVGLQNRGLGLLTVQVAAQSKLNHRLSCYGALGWLRSAQSNPTSGSSDIGVELLGELQWQLSGSLGLDLGAAYLWTGDFYKSSPVGAGPDNLFTGYLRLQLEF